MTASKSQSQKGFPCTRALTFDSVSRVQDIQITEKSRTAAPVTRGPKAYTTQSTDDDFLSSAISEIIGSINKANVGTSDESFKEEFKHTVKDFVGRMFNMVSHDLPPTMSKKSNKANNSRRRGSTVTFNNKKAATPKETRPTYPTKAKDLTRSRAARTLLNLGKDACPHINWGNKLIWGDLLKNLVQNRKILKNFHPTIDVTTAESPVGRPAGIAVWSKFDRGDAEHPLYIDSWTEGSSFASFILLLKTEMLKNRHDSSAFDHRSWCHSRCGRLEQQVAYSNTRSPLGNWNYNGTSQASL
ncbi:hypothetical protein DL96DRAFT_192022 [Flagelloscypha sp. PMI_526]|nr:hypothetical protein DL96DRAFT_192022 [Flagelloscypha sp. PMI_526]